MFSDRLQVLRSAYKTARQDNQLYLETKKQFDLESYQLNFLSGLHMQLKGLDSEMTAQESAWRESVLSTLEAEITSDLAYVYPQDGYRVKLSSRVSRGKIHIESRVYSVFAQEIPGRIRGTQGRLFQQVVSFAGLRAVMTMLGVKTIYIDEAFSGASLVNASKLNSLLASLKERGYNIIMIAQNTAMAEGIDANRLFLSRTVDNKTVVESKGGSV